MQIFHHLDEWRQVRHSLKNTTSLGFVPTMGNLHRGHATLYNASLKDNDLTVASIFINPTQFNQIEDLTNYPRTLDADLALLSDMGVDYCLLPTEQAIYPDGYRLQVHENKLSQLMEGPQRPGHFSGVLTVVLKLLNLVKPHRAYFGEKDYQQFQLIQSMVKDFFMSIEIIPCPTIREESGLPYSSRNNRLNSNQRQLAAEFARLFHQGIPREDLIKRLDEINVQVEYLEEFENRRYIAVKIGEIRLIDNYPNTMISVE